MIEIYMEYDNELSEYEAQNKGYRHDVYVKIDGNFYHVNVYTLNRLQQDFDEEFHEDGFYSVLPNMIFVKDTNKNEIVSAISRLEKQRYFEALKPIAIEKNKTLTLVHAD